MTFNKVLPKQWQTLRLSTLKGIDNKKKKNMLIGIPHQGNPSGYSTHKMCKNNKNYPFIVLQLGFEGRGVSGMAIFARPYKDEGTMCHEMCLVSGHVTKYNPIPQ